LQLTRQVTVTVGDTDFTRHLKPSAIMGYCQDIATEHAEMLGFGYNDLAQKNLAWVMIRMSFKVFKSPQLGDVLTITTLPENPKTLDVNRGYYIYNANGDLIISASSKWCTIDINTHKISRLTSVFENYTEADFVPFEPFENANPKIQTFADYNEKSLCSTFQVQITDLDQNLHMNNARYGDIILNACEMDQLKENEISHVDLNFMSQLFINDKYEVYKTQKENTTFIEVRNPNSNVVIFRAIINWIKK
jgi:acyl-ACP thioesterase